MTRSEERMRVGTTSDEAARTRLREHVGGDVGTEHVEYDGPATADRYTGVDTVGVVDPDRDVRDHRYL